MLLKCPYVHEHRAGHCMVGQAAKKKRVIFFFLFWLEEVSFHCVEYSNEFELKIQQMRRKKKQQQQKQKFQLMKSLN